MGSSRTRYEKIQRERSRRERATAKRVKRLSGPDAEGGTEGGEETPDGEAVAVVPEGTTAADIMDMLAAVHNQYETDEISFEEFEQRKSELLALMTVD
jgi:hypothetical protein